MRTQMLTNRYRFLSVACLLFSLSVSGAMAAEGSIWDWFSLKPKEPKPQIESEYDRTIRLLIYEKDKVENRLLECDDIERKLADDDKAIYSDYFSTNHEEVKKIFFDELKLTKKTTTSTSKIPRRMRCNDTPDKFSTSPSPSGEDDP